MGQKASNWALCPREKHLLREGLAMYPPFPEGIRERGAQAEAIVARRYGWQTQQVKVTLDTGRNGYIDYLDEQGCPVEVKGLSGHTFARLTEPNALWNGHTYQRGYVVQLASYCKAIGKKGKFILVNMDDPRHPEKHFLLSLEDALMICAAFAQDKIRPTSCRFCKVSEACEKKYGKNTGYEI